MLTASTYRHFIFSIFFYIAWVFRLLLSFTSFFFSLFCFLPRFSASLLLFNDILSFFLFDQCQAIGNRFYISKYLYFAAFAINMRFSAILPAFSMKRISWIISFKNPIRLFIQLLTSIRFSSSDFGMYVFVRFQSPATFYVKRERKEEME